jgi:hypothetical protein
MSPFTSKVVVGTTEEPALHGISPTVRVARTLPEIEDLRTVWESWCDDPNADLDSYLAFAHSRPEFVRPHVIILYRDGRPDCMLLGRLENCRLKLKVGYKTLFELRARRIFFVRGGYLGNASEDNIRLIIQELRSCLQRGEADVAELQRGFPNPTVDRSILEQFNPFFRGHFSPAHEHRWLELPPKYEEFLKNLSRKSRHEIRRHEKKLEEDFRGRMVIRCFHEPFEVEALAQVAEQIAEKTYQRALGVGYRADPETLESFRLAAQQGTLRGCVLYLNEQPSAFFIGKHYKSTLHGHFMGFDSQFGKYSPGLLILMHSIQDCFKAGQYTNRVDLGWGDRHYKRMLCNRSREDGSLYSYAFSWRGLRLNFLTSLVSFIDYVARESLAKSSWLQNLKEAQQSRLRKSTSQASFPPEIVD